MEFDKIVLIAGGGGATFTFGLAVNVLERMNDEARKKVVFLWAVKKHGEWYPPIILFMNQADLGCRKPFMVQGTPGRAQVSRALSEC